MKNSEVSKTPRPNELDQLLHKVFLRYAWGADDKPELRNEAGRFISQAQEMGLYERIHEVVHNGREAYRLGQYLESLLNSRGLDVTRDWLELQSALHANIQTHLKKTLESWLKRQEQLKERKASPVYCSSITPVVFSDRHPNSLRHLSPASDWTVYIDETGQMFDETAKSEAIHSIQVGRVVALVVPSRTQLKPLPTGFHATEAPPETVDQTLEYILGQDVGIFGFSVNDPSVFAGNWFNHIVLLARWVLLQLPIDPSTATRVNFLIERNDARLAHQSIGSLANLLEGELQAIDAERYATVQISTQLMSKNHVMNGYVDTLAFTWGSPSAVSKDRLKKSALLGHCFLRPDQQAMEHLYLAVGRGNKLLASDWFAFCTAAAQEPDGGVLGRCLQQLGEKVQLSLASWQYYLDEVRAKFRSKDYRLAEINFALDWLEKYIPEGEELPAIYRLPLETSRLSQENHSGKVNMARLQTCFQLINQLEEEDAQQACGALLRVAVSGSNHFEFKILQPMLEKWLAMPIAVSGLANYARLHSSLGQMYAFAHESQAAIAHFDQALVLFDRLSDKRKAMREKQQTNAYRMICLMDQDQVNASTFLAELASNGSLADYSRLLAASGQSLRYSHHLWLRTLLCFPEVSVEARMAYLEVRHQWQYGEDHPWGLIDAYRAWLLKLEGKDYQANERMINAIQLCSKVDSGSTLWWMAEVLRTLAKALNLQNVDQPSAETRSYLQKVLPAAPHESLSIFAREQSLGHEKIMYWLKQCLPFNFH